MLLLQATAPQAARTATGRICRGGEVDPLYVDVIIRRYQSFEAATRDGRSAQEVGVAGRFGERVNSTLSCP